MRTMIVLITAALTVSVLAGCSVLFGDARSAPDRFAQPGHPVASPSGKFVARVDIEPEQNGVETWIVVIDDVSGRKVFRDTDAYSSRHGVGITWLSGADELWLLSSDIGTSSVARGPDGGWRKEFP
ncbi:MAG: hypothetical protein WKF54_14035 [Nocardioidaceae bacterium]|jgi:hypothetical protein